MDIATLILALVLIPIAIGITFLLSLFKVTDYIHKNQVDYSEYLESLEDK